VTQADVVVLGGGPAGSVAAAGLARQGHDVLLLARPRASHRSLAESLPPSSRKLLAASGLIEAVERAGFFPNGGNTVWWAGEDGRSESFSGDFGFQIDALRFEQVALDVAQRAGVRVVRCGASTACEDGDGWTVAGLGLSVRSPWLIDATGRAGIIARRSSRVKGDDPRTLALIGRWQSDAWDPAESTHTLVESYRDGWAWSVPISASLRCVTAMVDPDLTELDRRGDLWTTYLTELRKTQRIAERLETATLQGRVWACPATTHTARPFARPGLLLVGDAGSFIDPLSSFGVKKALASAWLAAIVVHSARADASITSPAVDLFDLREREMYERYSALTRSFFAAGAAHHAHPFWTSRTGGGPHGPAVSMGSDVELQVDAVRVDAHVRAALDDLRGRGILTLVPGESLRTIRRPTIRKDRIVLEDMLATDQAPEGVSHVRGVDVRRLVAAAPAEADVPALYAVTAPGSPLPDFLGALAWAIARGFLRHAR
jgi:flavin-dependent dehydrogenase